ncbi:MAG: radical SAM peptide maturase, CXXX-repeat target family [Aliifodinibius sp.]|nr:radical SAM peptide maturase, CXXX-repeat target family [Fodinibius sp.]NIV10601.1 radical SAM peptide maturase, CXXX-repeat target family [Fodinibius sp.]NIY24229.1 radical SAM peptide maturase, CXXX-repeat target family [Fodinibius sp.]
MGEFTLGKGLRQYLEGRARYCTLVLTEQCNLRCKYCYEIGKNVYHTMTRQTALRAIDFFLNNIEPGEGVVLEFTGGECTLQVDLMRNVIEYFKEQLFHRPNHPWSSAYTLMFSSNGTLYHTNKFQRLLWENKDHSYPAITIDGTKRKHDMSRVFPDGRGSYDVVAKNVKLWIKQFPGATTKITFSSDDLPYVCESIVHVWKLGVRYIGANVVFEDVWKSGDSELFENELKKLADISIEQGFWKTHDCTLFWVPHYNKESEDDDKNWCGTGSMLSVDSRGNLFPCLRFQGFCLSNRQARPIGNIYEGFDHDVLRSFYCLRKSLQSPKMCVNCKMSDQCAWCTALNYDAADSDTIFQRAVFICEMHKARWRANQYYWNKLKAVHGVNIQNFYGTSKHSCPI